MNSKLKTMKTSLQNLVRTKNNYLLLLLLTFMGTLLLESCKKEMQINNLTDANDLANANSNLALSTIIYTDVNPDVTMIGSDSTANQYYSLDLNNDDTTDFYIRVSFLRFYSIRARGVEINSFDVNGVICDSSRFPLAMNLGDKINSNSNWAANIANALRSLTGNNWEGNWTTTTDHYLGLKIRSGNNIYYGWVRLRVLVVQGKSSVKVKDYAYNSIPNKRILAGQMK